MPAPANPLIEIDSSKDALGCGGLTKYLKNEVAHKKIGAIMLTTGNEYKKTGNGKTENTAMLLDTVDKDFHLGKIAISPKEYLAGLDEIESTGRAGQCIMLDESHISANRRLWYSWQNRAVMFTMSTQRTLKALAAFISPSAAYLDSSLLPLMDFRMVTELQWDHRDRVHAYASFYRIFTDFDGNKVFRKNLRFFDVATHRTIVGKKYLFVNRLREDLRIPLEKKINEYKSSVRRVLGIEADHLDYIAAKKASDLEEVSKRMQMKMMTPKAVAESILNNDFIQSQLINEGKVKKVDVEYVSPDLPSGMATSVAGIVNILYSGRKHG
jgi:hypothetical protein